MSPLSRREFLKSSTAAGLSALLAPSVCDVLAAPLSTPPNVVMVTVDDLNYDAMTWLGGKISGLTPNIDRLAEKGMRFTNAFNTHSRCAPSRGSMLTGLYQDRYCERPGTGNTTVKEGVMPLPAVLKETLGYRTGLLAKETHYRPIERYQWDTIQHMTDMGMGRDPERYYQAADAFFKQAQKEGKPFFLSANSHDPHRPFAGADGEMRSLKRRFEKEVTGRPGDPQFYPPMSVDRYAKEDGYIPGFLPDLPEIREEISWYLNSAYRCDLFVGKMMQALKDNGLEDNTLVVFLSDNGMHFPFAKSNCYLTSVKTPLVFYWKGHISAGMRSDSMISSVDLMPTILDLVGCSAPHAMDGRSFVDLFENPEKEIRDFVFASINAKGRQEFQMRSIIGKEFGYIYNHFADGKQMFYDGKYPGGTSLRAMIAAAKNDPEMQKRIDFMYYRTKEEFYHYRQDADALTNLIDSQAHAANVSRMRLEMLKVLKKNGDPYAGAFAKMIGN